MPSEKQLWFWPILYFFLFFRTLLIQDYGFFQRISLWPPLVTVGIYCASLSAAMCAMIGASRILHALAVDHLFGKASYFVPFLFLYIELFFSFWTGVFSTGWPLAPAAITSNSGNPWVAVLYTWGLAQVSFCTTHVFNFLNWAYVLTVCLRVSVWCLQGSSTLWLVWWLFSTCLPTLPLIWPVWLWSGRLHQISGKKMDCLCLTFRKSCSTLVQSSTIVYIVIFDILHLRPDWHGRLLCWPDRPSSSSPGTPVCWGFSAVWSWCSSLTPCTHQAASSCCCCCSSSSTTDHPQAAGGTSARLSFSTRYLTLMTEC